MQTLQRFRRRSSGASDMPIALTPAAGEGLRRSSVEFQQPVNHTVDPDDSIDHSDGMAVHSVYAVSEQDGGTAPKALLMAKRDSDESIRIDSNPLFSGGTPRRRTSELRRSSEKAADLGILNADSESNVTLNMTGRRHTRNSLTDGELQQVLESSRRGEPHVGNARITDDGDVSPTKHRRAPERASASSAGASTVGSAKQLGGRLQKQKEMAKFLAYVKAQSSTEYVPIAYAEMILTQATTTAEETKTRHQEVIVALEATYREIDEKTRRHYAELIIRLQAEMRTELKRLDKDRKGQEEVAETLRDKIATITAEAAARESKTAEEWEHERRERAKETADAAALRTAMALETRSAVETLAAEARKEREGYESLVHLKEEEARRQAEADRLAIAEVKRQSAVIASERVAEGRRKSVQRQELEGKTIRATVALVLESLVHSVELGEDEQGRADLSSTLSTAERESQRLRIELEESLHAAEFMHAEVARLEKEVLSLQQEARKKAADAEVAASQKATAEDRDRDSEQMTKELGLNGLQQPEAEKLAPVQDSDKQATNLVRARCEADEVENKSAAESMDSKLLDESAKRQIAELEAANESLNRQLADAQKAATVAKAAAAAAVVTAVLAEDRKKEATDVQGKEVIAKPTKEERGSPGAAAPRTIEQVEAELQDAVASKKKVKEEIKKWLKDFEEKEGRPASNDDKATIRDQFVAHKRLEKSTAKLTNELSTLQTEANDLSAEPSTASSPPGQPVDATASRASTLLNDNSESAVDAVPSRVVAATDAHIGAALQSLREENNLLRARLAAATDKGSAGETSDDPTTTAASGGPDAQTRILEAELARMAKELQAAREAVTDGSTKLQESEQRKAVLKTALAELNETTTRMLAEAASARPGESGDKSDQTGSSFEGQADAAVKITELETSLKQSQEDQALAAEEAKAREKELEASLEAAQKESRSAALALKKSEHLSGEASAALEQAQAELKASQLVVDESSEAARLRQQVAELKADLEAKSRAATAGWDAAAGAESEAAAAEARGLQIGLKRGRMEADRKIRTLKEALASLSTATAAGAAMSVSRKTSTRQPKPRSATGNDSLEEHDDDASRGGGESDEDGRGTKRLAEQLAGAERELDNLREREEDFKGEATRAADELQRLRVKLEKQRARESDLASALSTLEGDREMLSRGLMMAEERAALALELVAAQKEDAVHARQDAAISAAQARRASRDQGGQGRVSINSTGSSDHERVAGGRPPTTSTSRRQAEQLRLVASALVHAIKEGTELWRTERRTECHALYAKAGARAISQMPPGQAQDDLRVALAAARGLNPAKAAVALRKAFDTVLEAARAAKEAANAERDGRRTTRSSSAASTGSAARSASAAKKAIFAKRPPSSSSMRSVSDAGLSEAEDGGESGDRSKVASLQRQLDALTSRQRESDFEAKALDAANATSTGSGVGGANGARLEAATRRCAEMEDRIDELEAECRTLQEALDDRIATSGEGAEEAADAGGNDGGLSGAATGNRDQLQKIRSLEKKNREEAVKVRKLEAQLTKMDITLARAVEDSGSGSTGDLKAMEKQKVAQEAKMKNVVDEVERKSTREIQKLTLRLDVATQGLDSCKADLEAAQKERDELRQQVAAMGRMGKEMQSLRTRAADATRLEKELREAEEEHARLQGLYQMEQVLRKKYWNVMEDMKGKIRVFARCRPMARYELDRDCQRAVTILDEATVEVAGHHGPKQFVFDTVFTEAINQEAVFEDTKRLVQSALDGFNVCVFAYGQTGSGKTWTMTGGDGDNRGLIPRAIDEIFGLIEKSKGSIEAKVSCYFVELYLDNIRDLFFAMDHPQGAPPKLDIKLDVNKMVFLKNVVMKDASSAQELSRLFALGNAQRKVSGTKMNAESSRSHSIFSVIIEASNRQTFKTSTGKLSLVDLAGSERADKTGATADRLKEAQSINKSLSALGDVISALSTGEKFVPYRNNKLTQMMQDSLGGNAKTLMFVNISPADYNQEETATALTYATRVKQITNTASKQQDGEEVARLKDVIRKLKAREHHDDSDGENGSS